MSTDPIAVHTITQANAQHVLYVLADGSAHGVEPGSFMTRLIEATLVADPYNRERLARGFEGVVAAVQVYKDMPGGLELLRTIAGPAPATPF